MICSGIAAQKIVKNFNSCDRVSKNVSLTNAVVGESMAQIAGAFYDNQANKEDCSSLAGFFSLSFP